MSAPVARTVPGSSPFTVAWVPTGMNAGVAIVPCAVVISPERAEPSVATRRYVNASAMLAVVSARRAEQQARIAVRIEAIAVRDRMRIGALHDIEAAERRYQH